MEPVVLRPASLVLVGASERSRWSRALLANLSRHGFAGPVHLVNRGGTAVDGRAAARSCAELGAQADLGVVMVPAPAVPDAVAGLADAGARAAVVLTSGFAETGPDGAARQAELVRAARGAGLTVLGPNSLGFLNLHAGVVAWATPIELPARRDGIALVSQSGATAFFLAALAQQQDVGLSHVVATGNEAMLDLGTVVRHLVDDPAVRVVAVFAETVRDPARFLDAAEAAQAAGKPLVVLKVGSSPATARSALAHTGALVGDDRVFDGVCARHGIVRVRSLEDLLTTADVLARTGRLGAGGLCVVSNSGGVCEIAADTAEALGVPVPEIPADTVDAVVAALPDYGTPHNPLDLTGGVEPAGAGDAVAALGRSGAYSATLVPFYPVPEGTAGLAGRQDELYRHLARGLAEGGVPGFLVSYTAGGIGPAGRAYVRDAELPYLSCGLDRALRALACARAWSAATPRTRSLPGSTRVDDRPRSERETLALLGRHGVPVVPQTLATTPDEALAAARASGGPVAVKLASPDVAHKSDVGGVVLGVDGDEEVRAAFARVTAAAGPGVRVEGALVSPMRTGGVELFVGCSVDPVWGPVLALGLGGVHVEVADDVVLRQLPVAADEVVDMLRALRGAALLRGARGAPPADLGAVGAAVAALGDLALALGPELAALEVNPLLVAGSRVEALDALAVWEPLS
ncbi:acetate--CoA ligase family protein [Pseudonocardia sp. RS010]|uniref:acetate--CoA ligase family protein n=1 Tax=Pseudonocardia sp. RS010 TaxID=3385979 RepID=UPI0039A3EA4A